MPLIVNIYNRSTKNCIDDLTPIDTIAFEDVKELVEAINNESFIPKNADLRNIDFRGHILKPDEEFDEYGNYNEIDFENSDLSNSNLNSQPYAYNFRFLNVTANNTNFSCNKFEGNAHEFSGIHAENANFSHCIFCESHFYGAYLKDANMTNIQAWKVDFDDADLSGATFLPNDRSGHLNCYKTNFSGSTLPYDITGRAYLENAIIDAHTKLQSPDGQTYPAQENAEISNLTQKPAQENVNIAPNQEEIANAMQVLKEAGFNTDILKQEKISQNIRSHP